MGTAAAAAEGRPKRRGRARAPKRHCFLENLAVLAVPNTPDQRGVAISSKAVGSIGMRSLCVVVSVDASSTVTVKTTSVNGF